MRPRVSRCRRAIRPAPMNATRSRFVAPSRGFTRHSRARGGPVGQLGADAAEGATVVAVAQHPPATHVRGTLSARLASAGGAEHKRSLWSVSYEAVEPSAGAVGIHAGAQEVVVSPADPGHGE